MFDVGDLVMLTPSACEHYCWEDEWLALEIMEVVEVLDLEDYDGALYQVRFDDGSVSGFYGWELERV